MTHNAASRGAVPPRGINTQSDIPRAAGERIVSINFAVNIFCDSAVILFIFGTKNNRNVLNITYFVRFAAMTRHLDLRIMKIATNLYVFSGEIMIIC